MSEFIIDSAIQEFHVYKSLWTPEIREELSTVRETANTHDRFAVALCKGTLTVVHVPAELCWVFNLRRGGTVNCRVSTSRHRQSPLEQDRLEVPCELIFIADDLKLLKKIVLYKEL